MRFPPCPREFRSPLAADRHGPEPARQFARGLRPVRRILGQTRKHDRIGGGYAAIETAAIIGTLLDAASAARTDRRGDEGTTMVKMSVHTATHESPIHVAFRKSRPCG